MIPNSSTVLSGQGEIINIDMKTRKEILIIMTIFLIDQESLSKKNCKK